MTDISRIRGTTDIPDTTGINPPDKLSGGGRAQQSTSAAGQSFGEILRACQGVASSAPAPASALRFSGHAQTRLQSRNISLTGSQMDRLQGAVQKAAGKGSRDALVLMDDLAMVVSVTNRTVVTVVDKDNLKQNVFTNIDSAVIA